MTNDYIRSRNVQVTPGHNPNGLDMIHGPKAKHGGATSRQIQDIKLFWWFPLIPDDFRYGPSSIGNTISLPFQEVQERPNWMSYATWASALIWTAPWRIGLYILKLFRQFWSNLILDVPGTSAIGKVISSSFRAYVERPNLIWYASCTSNVQIRFGMRSVHQFEAEVVLNSELDSKSNSGILNWIGSPPWCVPLLASPAPSWCLIHSPHHLHSS
jgi:hypothetical protein